MADGIGVRASSFSNHAAGFSVFAIMGIVMMIGIVVNNAILIVLPILYGLFTRARNQAVAADRGVAPGRGWLPR